MTLFKYAVLALHTYCFMYQVAGLSIRSQAEQASAQVSLIRRIANSFNIGIEILSYDLGQRKEHFQARDQSID